MKTIFFNLMVEKIVEQNAKIGMVLTLGKETMTCVDITRDKYGERYIFDNGLGFTKSNIVSNIVKYQSEKKEWKIV